MPDGVGERLLAYAQQLCGRFRRQGFLFAAASKRTRNRCAECGFVQQRLQRRAEHGILQQAGAERPHRPSGLCETLPRKHPGAVHMVKSAAEVCLQGILGGLELNGYAGESLGQCIVEIVGYPPPFGEHGMSQVYASSENGGHCLQEEYIIERIDSGFGGECRDHAERPHLTYDRYCGAALRAPEQARSHSR